MARFAVTSGSAPLVEAAGCSPTCGALSPEVTVFAPSPCFPAGDNRPFLLQFRFFDHTGQRDLALRICRQRGIEIFAPNAENGPGRASIHSLKDR
jgi:hypothetical protein